LCQTVVRLAGRRICGFEESNTSTELGRETDRLKEGMDEGEREVGEEERYVCYCGLGFPTKVRRRNHRRKDQCTVCTVCL
jgi:hypothetical protein